MQGFEEFARDTLMRGFSVPASALAALQAAEAKLPAPAARQGSTDSDQRVPVLSCLT